MIGQQERQRKMLEYLCAVREDKVENLAFRFQVSERTVRSDLLALSCEYPIETVRGRYGGVHVDKDFHLDRKLLTPKQKELLTGLAQNLSGEDLKVMQSILSQFAM